MMDAFSCDFCHHIFTADLNQRLLKTADTHLPMIWRWDGKGWRRQEAEGIKIGWAYIIAACLFVFIPPTLIGISALLFPPIPGSFLSWLPMLWTLLTFAAHLLCIAWLVVEYHQFPIGLYLRALARIR